MILDSDREEPLPAKQHNLSLFPPPTATVPNLFSPNNERNRCRQTPTPITQYIGEFCICEYISLSSWSDFDRAPLADEY